MTPTSKNSPYPSTSRPTTLSISGTYTSRRPVAAAKDMFPASTISQTDSEIQLSSLVTCMWHTEDEEDTRGQQIATWIGDSDLGILNENLQTCITNTALDWSITTPDCLPACSWMVNTALTSSFTPH